MDEQARTEMEEAERHEKLRADLMLVDGSALMKGMLDFRRVEVGNKPSATPQATVRFHLTAQPIFHKNFELVTRTFHEYLEKGYTLYILADSAKQTDRLASIFTEQASGIGFTPVNRTLHAGFADDDLKACFFTDHQIFDRFHKYNLRSDKARSGKVALSLKELQEFNIGDYVVHVDHGVGKFGGLVRIPNGDTMQEVIKIIYQNDDVVFVSIHSLHKVSKYRGKEGEPPRLNKLGTGAWERLERADEDQNQGYRTRPHQVVFPAPSGERFRLQSRQFHAARARGKLPLRGHARPVEGHAGREGRHGARPSDGPSGMWGCGIRQDRGGHSRCLQGLCGQ